MQFTRFGVAVIAIITSTIPSAHAQNAVWIGNGSEISEFGTATNWSPHIVPNETAIFGNTTSRTVNGVATIGALQFNAGALQYTFNTSLTLTGAGILNDSTNTPVFNTNSGYTPVNFKNASSAGNAVIYALGANGPSDYYFGSATFSDISTAASANITSDASYVFFRNYSTAGKSTITIVNGGETKFFDSSSAGAANIIVGTVAGLRFNNFSSADHATITNNFVVDFLDASSAGNSFITNIGEAFTVFTDRSTAGSATIVVNSYGVFFNGHSDGGTSRLVLNDSQGYAGFYLGTGPNGDSKVSAGSVEGIGSVFLGANQLTLGGNNLSTVFNGNITDDIANNGITGGSLVKVGSGTLTLSGVNTLPGPTNISAGTLNITGSLASTVITVQGSGALAGTGKVHSVVVASGGTFSPGASSGTGVLTIEGDLGMAPGAITLVNITPTSSTSVMIGSFSSLDGRLIVNAAPGSYALGRRYTLITAIDGLGSTTFSSYGMSAPSAYKPNISYDANNVFLTLSANAITPLLPSGFGANQTGAASVIDAAIEGGATVNSGFNALFGLSGAALGGAITQASGADAAQAGSQSFLPFVSMLMSQGGGNAMTAANFAPDSSYGAGDAPRPAQLAVNTMRVWGSAFGRHTGIAADPVSGAQSLKAGAAGIAAGIEMQVSDVLLLGTSAAGGHGSFNAGNGAGNSDDAMIGAYARLDVMDAGYLAGALSYGWHDIKTVRVVTVSGTDVLAGNYDANDIGGRVEGGYRVALDEQYTMTPFAAFTLDSFQAPAYAETAVSGTANFALSYAAHDNDFAHSELGARIGRGFRLDGGMLGLEASAAWSHQLYGAPFALVAFQAFPSSSFVVHGVRPANDTALLGLGLDVQDDNGLAYGAHIESEVGGNITSIAGSANIAWRW
jgi:autotransporter-associated beta strand protein